MKPDAFNSCKDVSIMKLRGLINLIYIFVVLALSGCIGNEDNISEEKIIRPPGATDEDIIKNEIKSISQSDGPRGVVLFFNSMNEKGDVVIDAKADEPSDFVDAIAAIAIIDKRLIAQNINVKEYTIKYSGIYMPNKGTFKITSAHLDQIAEDAENLGLVDSVITRMSSGDLGEQLKIHGMATEKHYTPSSEKTDMYMGYERVPDLTIRIVR